MKFEAVGVDDDSFCQGKLQFKGKGYVGMIGKGPSYFGYSFRFTLGGAGLVMYTCCPSLNAGNDVFLLANCKYLSLKKRLCSTTLCLKN